MQGNRRDFIRGTVLSLAAAMAANEFGGCRSLGGYGTMAGFACAPMKRIRVGFIGVGERGTAAVHRIALFPDVETAALCDLRPKQVDAAKDWLRKKGKTGDIREYKGREDSWKGLCDDPNVDVVYICTPAQLHPEMAIYAMNAGKHVLTEVPGAQTLDECWEMVETSERTRRHCMMLENCCYGEKELLAWNLVHKGLLGTLTHAEGAYIHSLTWRQTEDSDRNRLTRERGISRSYGCRYPTHALGPICFYMDMNRGDRMERVVSMSSLGACRKEYSAAAYAPDAWQNRHQWLSPDMNTSIIKTAKGRTIMMQYDTATPRPYTRLNLIQGTKGCFADYPLRVMLNKRPGGDATSWASEKHVWMDDAQLAKLRTDYAHPLWTHCGEVSKRLGGHDGCDLIMDLRWIYCLQRGLPLDMDVYDLAAWSSIVPCSAESDIRGGEPVELPDFTRGAWATAKPISIGDVDPREVGIDPNAVQKDNKQLAV